MIRKRVQYTSGSLFVIVPKAFAELMGLKQGSEVDLDYESADRKLIILAAEDKKNDLKQAPSAVDAVTGGE